MFQMLSGLQNYYELINREKLGIHWSLAPAFPNPWTIFLHRDNNNFYDFFITGQPESLADLIIRKAPRYREACANPCHAVQVLLDNYSRLT